MGATDLLAHLAVFLIASGLGAPSPAPPPAPVLPRELKLGLSYLATTGNTDTSSLGFDAAFRKEWARWAWEGNAAALAATRNDRNTAESYNVQVRARRKAHRRRRPQLTAGLRAERNRFAGARSKRPAQSDPGAGVRCHRRMPRGSGRHQGQVGHWMGGGGQVQFLGCPHEHSTVSQSQYQEQSAASAGRGAAPNAAATADNARASKIALRMRDLLGGVGYRLPLF